MWFTSIKVETETKRDDSLELSRFFVLGVENMKTKLTFLLALTFLFLFSGSVYGDDFQDGLDAYKRQDYKTAYKLWLPLAEQGDAKAQYNLGQMYYDKKEVPQDYKEAVKWYRLAAEQGNAEAQINLDLLLKETENTEAQNNLDLLLEKKGDSAAQSILDLLLKKKYFWKRVKGIFGQSN